MLTGRVGGVTGQAALDPETNKYVAFAPRRREGNINMYSLFAQDSWRTTPTLTINAGLRWDLQMPFTAANDTMSAATMASVCGVSGLGDGGTYSKCNFAQPGASGGAVPEYVQLTSGTKGYETDWNNIAPNVGVAWRPNVQSGLHAHPPRRSRSGDIPRGLVEGLRAAGDVDLHRPLRRQPGEHDCR